LLSGSNVSQQSSDTGNEVGVGSIIVEVDIAMDVEETNKTVAVTGLAEDCKTDVVKDELDVVVVKGVDELITVVVVCTVEVVDVVVEEVEKTTEDVIVEVTDVVLIAEELCGVDELNTLDEVVGCTIEVVEKRVEVTIEEV